jgi:hypothetical protein
MRHRCLQPIVVVLCASVLGGSGTEPVLAARSLSGVTRDWRANAPIRTVASAYKGTNRSVAVVVLTIELDLTLLGLTETTRGSAGPLAVRWTATDTRGRAHSGSLYDGLVTLTADEHSRASRHGVRIVSRLELPPGLYRLRLNTISTGRTEGLVTELEVPDFTAPLTMSGVAVASADAGAGAPALASRKPTPLPLPSAPTARREFEDDETLLVFAEVYESERRLEQGPSQGQKSDPSYRVLGDHTTNVAIELRAGDGSILKSVPAERSSVGLPAGTHAFVARLPLSGVPNGRYVLRLKARANIGDTDTATHDVAIHVRSRAAGGHAPRRRAQL